MHVYEVWALRHHNLCPILEHQDPAGQQDSIAQRMTSTKRGWFETFSHCDSSVRLTLSGARWHCSGWETPIWIARALRKTNRNDLLRRDKYVRTSRSMQSMNCRNNVMVRLLPPLKSHGIWLLPKYIRKLTSTTPQLFVSTHRLPYIPSGPGPYQRGYPLIELGREHHAVTAALDVLISKVNSSTICFRIIFI